MIRVPAAFVLALGLASTLAGCQQAGPSQSDAPVPVLDGTASDAMLPLDTATSQPPLDPRAARAARSGPAAEDSATEAAEPEADPDPAAPAPAPAE
ncbi:hypothetical protein H7F50_08220 [Novosphingobium flavum]|jgi:hypothetical protein|uniref:Argininosuccinate lyase n=1 Tax=Novosphingobium aerophilum TaxID=2839843 RepID=A0A7X1KC52_9SPHN|nr:hypothetical protein [Novosphingobium aerophilum]MBC2651860.1 hypothetical protein [Novosphingobium aerophilum]MBC2661741.1 hypothetical protein [Novosphingobium aerophilum]